MSLNLLFFAGAVVSGAILAVEAVVLYRMRKRKKPSLNGFEKLEPTPKLEDITLPEAADYSTKPEVSRVTRELRSDHDAVSTFSDAVSALAEPETKKTFLEIMTKLVREESKNGET